MERPSYNLRSPSVKRIMQEMKEMQADDSLDYVAEALEDNIFEWHFAIRGPSGTDFEGGIYHGRIVLPPEYPFKPPSFIMLTPSGRFEVNTKICLSISSYHPEHWQPSWSVRTALTALISFLPTPGNGALGSLDYPPEDRRRLAAESLLKVPEHGNAVRCQLIKDLHHRLLSKAAEPNTAAAGADAKDAAAINVASAPLEEAAQPEQVQPADDSMPTSALRADVSGTDTSAVVEQEQAVGVPPVPQSALWEERLLTLLAGALVALIVAILFKKFRIVDVSALSQSAQASTNL